MGKPLSSDSINMQRILVFFQFLLFCCLSRESLPCVSDSEFN